MKNTIKVQLGMQPELGDLSTQAGRDKLVAHLADLGNQIQALQRQNQVLAAALAVQSIAVPQSDPIAMPIDAEIDAREAFESGDGFQRLEYGNGYAYRWTGQGHESIVRSWVDRSAPLRLEMSLHSYGDARNRNAISLTVDSDPVPLQTDEKSQRSAPWPTHRFQRFTTVRLHVPHLLRPSDAYEPDERTLGIAFRVLRIVAA